MGLFAPLALLTLPLLAAIVALYLLRFRRPSAPVGSLHLWASLTRDREANSLWQRLNVQVLLMLQLLALLALILALARPWVPSEQVAGQNAIIVVDVSAGMGAGDATPGQQTTRLEAARAQALSIVDDLPQGATAALITTDEHATILVPPTSDKSRLRAALSGLQPHAAGTSMEEAMQLARALSSVQPNSVIRVLSDGVFPAVGGPELPALVQFYPLGTRSANQALTALSLNGQGSNLTLFAQVTNSDNLTVSRRLDLLLDGAPWNARTVTLSPGQTQEIVVEDVPMAARVVEAQLAGTDDLDVDDRAWVVNRVSAPANLLLVSEGDKFLETALALLPNITLYKVAPSDYDPTAGVDNTPFDLTIFDADAISATSAITLPAGNLLLVGPGASTSLFEVQGKVSDPVPQLSPLEGAASQGGEGRDPLLRFVDLSGLHVAAASRVAVPAWAHTVLDSDKGPLVIVGDNAGRKAGVVAFDLHESDLPVQTAFPLLVRNLVAYLLPDPGGGVPAEIKPGAVVGIEPVDKSVNRVLVEDPAGKEWAYPLSAERRRVAFAETSQTGVYYVTQYAGDDIAAQEAFVANLLLRDEAALQPNPSPGLPKGQPSGAAPQRDQETPFKRELWPTVALAGLILLLLEWLYGQRVALRRALLEWRVRRQSRPGKV